MKYPILTINGRIKNIPSGMEVNRRRYWLECPAACKAKIFRGFKQGVERFAVMRLVSYISVMRRVQHKDRNLFTNICSETLRAIAGNKYTSYLVWLEANAVIEINHIYSPDNHFSKSFRFTERAFNQKFTVTCWDTECLEDTEEAVDSKINETVFTPNGEYDAELLYCLDYERQIRVPDSDAILMEMPEEDVAYASYWFDRINSGKSLPKEQNESTRFYFNSIRMSKHLRKHLRLNNSKLVNFDIKAAFPTFIKILSINQDYNNCRSENNIIHIRTTVYESLIGELVNFRSNGDFYDKLLVGSPYATRDEVKDAFNSYRNSEESVKKKHFIDQRLREMGEDKMADVILSMTKEDGWKQLEKMETELLCSICNRCIDEDLVFIRQHDGFLTIPENVDRINVFLSEYPNNLFQYKSEQL